MQLVSPSILTHLPLLIRFPSCGGAAELMRDIYDDVVSYKFTVHVL